MIITVEKGSFAYNGGRTILKEVSLEAKSGDLLAVLGPNGAGKTTLLRCIMGFLKWKSGKSAIDETDIRNIPQRELWQKIAYVPQSKGAATAFTAQEMILLGRSSHLSIFEKPSVADIDRVDAIMEKLNISELKTKKCSEISGGELQMVLIGRALAAEPQILILDEPESNLDFKNQLIVLDTMSELAAKGMTCIFNTHYPAHALQRANKSFILCRDGSYIFGETRNTVTEENICRAFGVRAVIGEIETQNSIMRNVIPLEVIKPGTDFSTEAKKRAERTIAVIAIITDNFEIAGKINAILHEYNSVLVGRMGMPYRNAGINIINVTVDTSEDVVNAITDRLSVLPGVSVKATFAKNISAQGDHI